MGKLLVTVLFFFSSVCIILLHTKEKKLLALIKTKEITFKTLSFFHSKVIIVCL